MPVISNSELILRKMQEAEDVKEAEARQWEASAAERAHKTKMAEQWASMLKVQSGQQCPSSAPPPPKPPISPPLTIQAGCQAGGAREGAAGGDQGGVQRQGARLQDVRGCVDCSPEYGQATAAGAADRPRLGQPRPGFGAAWGCSLARRESQRLTEALGSWSLLSGAKRKPADRLLSRLAVDTGARSGTTKASGRCCASSSARRRR
eukprot:scaffold133272_cov62-Phaeocystis_antarctica.AAC.3